MFKSWILDKLSFHFSPAISYLFILTVHGSFLATDDHTVFFVDSRKDSPADRHGVE